MKKIDIFYGKIIEITSDSVQLDVLIEENLKIIEKRCFSIIPFKDHITLNPEVYVKIVYTSEPGKIEVTFDELTEDLINSYSHYFEIEWEEDLEKIIMANTL